MSLVLATTWSSFAHASVSSGCAVSLAVICLLQYLVHVHRMNRARRETNECRRELHGVSHELDLVQRDRTLTRYENQVMREFMLQMDSEKAVHLFIRRFVGDADDGFAAFLRGDGGKLVVADSIGLSRGSVADFAIDEKHEQRLARGGSITLQGTELRDSQLWKNLVPQDRSKVQQVHLIGVGGQDELLGALVTTDLVPAGADLTQQLELAARLVSAVSTSLRDKLQLESHQDQLRSKGHMLDLRSIADRRFDSPLQMIEVFVREAAMRVNADRVALFVFAPDQTGTLKALIRAGEPLAAGMKDHWRRYEDMLAAGAVALIATEHYTVEALAQLGIETLMGAALVVPVLQENRPIGLLCFSRRGHDKFDDSQRTLGNWSGGVLAEMIPRLVNQVAVERQARLDGLTQLSNRGAFDKQIQHELKTARTAESDCSLLLFDLDRFKSINDVYGHRGGDAVLRAVADLIRDCMKQTRSGDRALGANPFLARYGGEELAVLLPRLGAVAAKRIGELIRTRLESRPVEFEGQLIRVTTSVGLATFPDQAGTAEELISAADAALYQAKAAGRNRLVVAEKALAVAGGDKTHQFDAKCTGAIQS